MGPLGTFLVSTLTRSIIVLFCAWLLLVNATNEAGRPEDHHECDNGETSHNFQKGTRDPKVVVFGNSLSDRGRRFEAPASFKFRGIGVFPWEKVFVANDTEEMVEAFSRGSTSGPVTNGKAWTGWLGVDEDLNFATSSASLSDTFRSVETCTGYTGEGEEFPTGTLEEQIDRYVHEVVNKTSATLGHVHIIFLGANDVLNLVGAYIRYIIGQTLEDSGAFGGEAYEDPVPYEKVFELVDSVPQLTTGPLITEVVTALTNGVARLLEAGVTGEFFVGNVLSTRGLPYFNESGLVDIMEPIIVTVNDEIFAVVKENAQLALLDFYTLFGSIVDDPETWTELGFVAPEDEEFGETLPLGTQCFEMDFAVDSTAEIMGTQAFRSTECQEECALCADETTPCQACYVGNPSGTVCDSPDTHIMWDIIHPTTAAYRFLSDAIEECVGGKPNYNRPLVDKLCPAVFDD